MKTLLIAFFCLLTVFNNTHAQEVDSPFEPDRGPCAQGQIYGCGAFYIQHFPPITQTICGCFTKPDEPVSRGNTSIKSCKKECPLHDGMPTESGCQCLRGPVKIPGLRAPITLQDQELKALYKLRLKDSALYQLYIDTQLSGDTSQPPLPVEKFSELMK